MAALFGVAVTLTHGALGELYISTGTLFDRLVFLFIAMGVATYAKLRSARQQLRIRDTVLLWLLCVLAMNSKESGVLLPVLLGLYELCFVRERSLGARLKAVGPTFALLAVTAVVFVFGRVYRTPVLLQTAGYHVDPNIGTWWQHTAHYVGLLLYRGDALIAALALGGMLALAAVLRNARMLYGWLWFVLTLSPVALISLRPGYVLYVPLLGLAPWSGWISFEEMDLLVTACGCGGYLAYALQLNARDRAPAWRHALVYSPAVLVLILALTLPEDEFVPGIEDPTRRWDRPVVKKRRADYDPLSRMETELGMSPR